MTRIQVRLGHIVSFADCTLCKLEEKSRESDSFPGWYLVQLPLHWIGDDYS